MHEYWIKRKNKLEEDLEHVKRHMRQAREFEEKEHLQEVYVCIADELTVANEAVKQFG